MVLSYRKWSGLALAIVGLGVALWGAYVGSTAPILDYVRHVAVWGNPQDKAAASLEDLINHDYLLSNVLLVIGTALQIVGAALSSL